MKLSLLPLLVLLVLLLVAALARRYRRRRTSTGEASKGQTLCGDFSQLTSAQAAAVVMMTLPVDKSAEIFNRMTSESVQLVTHHVIALPSVAPEVRRQTLEHLCDRLGISTEGLNEMVQLRPEVLADELTLWATKT